MENNKPKEFSIDYTIQMFEIVEKQIRENKEVPFDEFCETLHQFCFVFKELNSFLGIAFSDVKDKVAIIESNRNEFQGHPGFISFIKMEIEKNIHILNGKNNEKKKAPKDFIKYNSTARNLLRMMWLLTFIKVTFSKVKENPKESLSNIFGVAYDEAFGENHGWLVRKSAKLAMMASQSREKFVEVILKGAYDEKKFEEYNNKFLSVLVPVHDFLWNFYKENKMDKLE